MSLWMVLLLSFLPGLGNFGGGMLAEFGKTSDRLLNWALHAASGIVIAIVAVELIPEALKALAGWWIAAAFGAGGIAYILVEMGVEKLQSGNGDDRTSMWMIYVAVAVDLTSDGLMLGSGAAVSSSLAIALAAGQVLADVPEGYASIANFRDKEVPRRKRILLSASFILFCVGAALLAYLLLRGAGDGSKRRMPPRATLGLRSSLSLVALCCSPWFPLALRPCLAAPRSRAAAPARNSRRKAPPAGDPQGSCQISEMDWRRRARASRLHAPRNVRAMSGGTVKSPSQA